MFRMDECLGQVAVKEHHFAWFSQYLQDYDNLRVYENYKFIIQLKTIRDAPYCLPRIVLHRRQLMDEPSGRQADRDRRYLYSCVSVDRASMRTVGVGCLVVKA